MRSREHRQAATLHRDRGTVTFFANRPWLLRHGPAHQRLIAAQALSFARARIRWVSRELAETRAALHVRWLASLTPEQIVRYVFGPYGDQALRVSRDCEAKQAWKDGDPTAARNGQYRGPFQMGARERAIYGDGRTMLEMTQAAWRYFVASGRDWSPWGCKP